MPIHSPHHQERYKHAECEVKLEKGLTQLNDLKGHINGLIEIYVKRKSEALFSIPYTLFGTNTERTSAIALIKLVADKLIVPYDAEIRSISKLESLTRRAKAFIAVIEGAYLFVMHDIELSYNKAWFSKKPTSSQLYQELSQHISEYSSHQKEIRLKALHIFFTKLNQNDCIYGSKTTKEVVKQTEAYISDLQSQEAAIHKLIQG